MIRYSHWQRLDQNGTPIDQFMIVRETWDRNPKTGKSRRSSGIDFRAPSIQEAGQRRDSWVAQEKERLGRRGSAKVSREEGKAQKDVLSPSSHLEGTGTA